MNFNITVYLSDTRNSNTFILNQKDWPDEETVKWVWTEGNYGCDCNRSIFMYGYDEQMKCNIGENIIKVDGITRDDTGLIILENV